MYETAQHAMTAVAKLKAQGFPEETINLVTAASVGQQSQAASASGSEDPIVSAITAGYVLRAHARVYAEAVRCGRALVSVSAAFGTGGIASEILDSCDPVDSGLSTAGERLPGWDDATPLSSALWLPVLAKGSASPLSSFWGLPVLTRKGGTFCSALGVPEVSQSAALLSSTLGMPLLSRNPAPLSSLLRIPLLT
jgi:hypothetical protein